MLPGPAANNALNLLTLQLQKTSQIFANKGSTANKFSEELLKQLNQTSSQQSQSLTSQVGNARPVTFIPGAGEAAAQGGSKAATSKRERNKKRAGSTGSISLPAAAGKR